MDFNKLLHIVLLALSPLCVFPQQETVDMEEMLLEQLSDELDENTDISEVSIVCFIIKKDP
ncbi:MAG TPA: hypothetical protein PKA53_13150 [Sphingobacterium sp.]|nr:hypothetical protein [Sphingobacterium sp.]